MTRSTPHIIKYLFHLFRGHKLQVTLNTLLGVTLVGLDLAFVWATKLVIDIATHHNQQIPLTHAFILIAFIMTLRISLSLSSRWIRATLGVNAQNDMQQQLFARLMHSEWISLKTYHTGHLTNRMERDVKDVVNFITEDIPNLVTTLVQFIGAFLFLFFMDSTLALIIVCVVPFFLVCSKLYVKKMRKLTHQSREEESRIQAIIQETLQHSLVVKTLQRVDFFINNLKKQQNQLHHTILQRTRYSTISAGLLSFGFGAGYFITFTWGTYSLSRGLITYGAMLAFIQLVGQIQSPIRTLSKFIPIFISAFTASERLMDIEDIPQEELTEPLLLPRPLGLQLNHVSYQYEAKSRLIFNDFSQVFSAKSIIAITGETGAGKTTLIRLLLSLIKPQQGSVTLIDGTGCTHAMSPHLRCNFAYVPQGNTLFSGTIRSNLLQARPTATEEELRKALHTASADFVLELPKGLDTPCSESGGGLSEGQAQRIAIARALLSDGSIIIFDEATSSLDSETEDIVLQRIVQENRNSTLIFITHRPKVLKYATQILHLEGKSHRVDAKK